MKAPASIRAQCGSRRTSHLERAERVSSLAFLTERAMAGFPYTATVRKRCTRTRVDTQGQNIAYYQALRGSNLFPDVRSCLRCHPFTAKTRVRFPWGAPAKTTS